MIGSTKAWLGTDLTKADVTFTFSAAAEAEIVTYLEQLHERSAKLDRDRLPMARTRLEVEELRAVVDEIRGFAVVDPLAAVRAPTADRAFAWLLGCLLGEPVEQSRDGIKVVQVYDRDRTLRMEDGARYHQTRQGGSIHTDNVNRPETWDYLIMACLHPAMIGGESIVVSGFTVHELLLERAPRALEVLAEDFWWERRGFSGSLFRAPVLFFSQRGEPQFRYLREYLESAHRLADEPLRGDQLWALDTLDSTLELSELQFRHKLAPGEILVIDDKQMFHGRTSFSDFLEAGPYEPGQDPADLENRIFRRCFDRLWISKRAA